MASSLNCYELLGVAQSANSAELRKAFRNLSKALHPDTTSLPYEVAASKFQKVCEAYDLLSDPALRADYDAELLELNIQRGSSHDARATNQSSKQESKLIGVRRPLSGGELFSLLLLVVSLLISLLVGIGFAISHGRELVFSPSWLTIGCLVFF